MNLNNETVLMESKTARENVLTITNEERCDEIFKKVKGLALLPDNTNITVDMASQYYETDKELIKYHIKTNKEELESDGLKVLKGKELKEFKEFLKVGESNYLTSEISNAPSLTLIPRRAMLRLGMLIQKSEIAKEIRTYLLNVEENSDEKTKLLSLSKDTNDGVKEMQLSIIDIKSQLSQVKRENGILITDNEELKSIANNLITKVDQLLEQPLFKIHENSSNSYEKLMLEFLDIMKEKGVNNTYSTNYTMFNKEFENWTGTDFKGKKVVKKQYWLLYFGLENIRQFIYGIKQGIIIKNDKGNWVSLSGIFSNKVEWEKIQSYFDHKCAYCGSEDYLIAEHIIPQTNDKSSDRIENVICSCLACNKEKDVLSMKEYLELLKSKNRISEEQIIKIREHFKKYKIKNI